MLQHFILLLSLGLMHTQREGKQVAHLGKVHFHEKTGQVRFVSFFVVARTNVSMPGMWITVVL